MSLRLLLVDDHALFRQSLNVLLTANRYQVVGMASNGYEALEAARRLRPDLILMDIEMPDGDGLTATRLIKAEMPDIAIVMLTVSADDEHLFAAIRSYPGPVFIGQFQVAFGIFAPAIHGTLVMLYHQAAVYDREGVHINSCCSAERHGISTPGAELWFVFLRVCLEEIKMFLADEMINGFLIRVAELRIAFHRFVVGKESHRVIAINDHAAGVYII